MPTRIPQDWDDSTIITIDELGELLGVTEADLSTLSDRGLGPRWTRFEGRGRRYVTAAEARRFLNNALYGHVGGSGA